MFRDLKDTDYQYLELFNSELSKQQFIQQYNKYNNDKNYYIKVLEENGKIIAGGSFIIKPKFVRDLKFEGYIFDLIGEQQYINQLLTLFLNLSSKLDCYTVDIDQKKLDVKIMEELKIKHTSLSNTTGKVSSENNNHLNLRLLEKNDFEKGFLDIMRGMYIVDKNINKDKYNLIYNHYKNNDNYFIVIKEDENKKLAGTGSILILDRIWNQQRVAIMDDIIVKKEFRKNNYSREIVSYLNYLSIENNCFNFKGKVRPDKLELWKKLIPSTQETGPNYVKYL